nr:uncharacterized protein LOC129384713 [Dermacentor andersoni]
MNVGATCGSSEGSASTLLASAASWSLTASSLPVSKGSRTQSRRSAPPNSSSSARSSNTRFASASPRVHSSGFLESKNSPFRPYTGSSKGSSPSWNGSPLVDRRERKSAAALEQSSSSSQTSSHRTPRPTSSLVSAPS